jgi:predicted enzyme related to lactoylglutathione lyase
MRCLLRLVLPLALLSGALLFVAVACNGADDERTAALIRGLLLAGRTGDAGEMETFVGELPPDLPVEPPIYPDAETVVSSRQPATSSAPTGDGAETPAQGMLYFIVLDSSDKRADVAEFYERALDQEPWQLEDTASTKDQDVLYFSDASDPDIGGAVVVARGEDDKHTSVFISLQDAGAEVKDEPPFELSESLALPKEFPKDVPAYDGSTVTSTAFHRAPGTESFLLIVLTTDSQDDVIAFYRGAFEDLGWTVADGTAEGPATSIDFHDDTSDIQGTVTADRFAQDGDYTEVTIQIQATPSREPAGGETSTPEEGDTPQPTDEETPQPTEDATPAPTSAGAHAPSSPPLPTSSHSD